MADQRIRHIRDEFDWLPLVGFRVGWVRRGGGARDTGKRSKNTGRPITIPRAVCGAYWNEAQHEIVVSNSPFTCDACLVLMDAILEHGLAEPRRWAVGDRYSFLHWEASRLG